VDPSDSSPNVTKEEWDELKDAARTFIQNLSDGDGDDDSLLSWTHAKPCLYTMSPDEHFFVGRPSGYQRTYAVAGLSGHGFKMTPALGQVIADMAIDGSSHLNVDFLSPSRFGV
jgi:sarcosine oxidase